VVICAHDELENLQAALPLILGQDYYDEDGKAAFEVIVVNDRSTDGTSDWLGAMMKKYSQLRVVGLNESMPGLFPGKKHALAKGVEASRHDIVLMTDADCRPASPQWIKWMAYPFSKGMDIVAGHGDFDDAPGWLNRFIRCETAHTYALYAGFCRRGKPYMAVGRNLACRKALLLQAQRSPLWKKTASGDDDMLIRLCADKDNMVVNAHPDSVTFSTAKKTWGEYLHQKQRHVSTGKYYSSGIKLLLGGYAMSHALFWLSLLAAALCALTLHYSLYQALSLLVFCGIILYIRFRGFHRALNQCSTPGRKSQMAFWPIFDISWMLYNIILSPYILWKSKQRWK
jgi:glycosyltransferase involved in cell wall biosynthesis